MKSNITPFLWFDTQAEQAAKFYVSVFKNSKIKQVTRYGKHGPGKAGTVMTVSFVLDGQKFIALNGGPHHSFSLATSFVIYCDTQKELDRIWNRLCKGGKPIACGWLQDRYGLSWQVVPSILPKLLGGPPEKKERFMRAMMDMVKLDIETLTNAWLGKTK